jgi:hypothetical protein
MASSPTTATKTFDSDGRLPLHCYIETLIKSVVQYEASSRDSARRILSNDDSSKSYIQENESFHSIIRPLRSMIHVYPDALECVDGKTNLYPFMQASAIGAESFLNHGEQKRSDNFTLSLVYTLLLEKPSILSAIK